MVIAILEVVLILVAVAIVVLVEVEVEVEVEVVVVVVAVVVVVEVEVEAEVGVVGVEVVESTKATKEALEKRLALDWHNCFQIREKGEDVVPNTHTLLSFARQARGGPKACPSHGQA